MGETGEKTGGKTVIVVEDERNIIEAISFILSRDGWDVKTHSNGHDAVEAVRARAPDLVILDVMLPGKSGFDILQDMRKDDELSTIPVLMLTARGQERDREMAERAGADRYMTKPFSNAEVLEAVRDLVGDERP
jgi:two-component system OmpR family response regulator